MINKSKKLLIFAKVSSAVIAGLTCNPLIQRVNSVFCKTIFVYFLEEDLIVLN